MMNKSFIIPLIFLLIACSANKKQSAGKLSNMPPCLVTKIQNIINDPKQTPPQSISMFTYKGKSVFYIVQPCCDQFNQVYDSDCNYLGAPDGGITGKGDGKIADFVNEAKDRKVVWENGK